MEKLRNNSKRRIAAFLLALALMLPSPAVSAEEYTPSLPVGDTYSAEDSPAVSALDEENETNRGEEEDPSDAESRLPEESKTTAAPLFDTAVYGLTIGGHEKYMSGYENGTFQPEKSIKRAEVAKIIYELLKNKPAAPAGQFTDVPDGKWYTTMVNALANAGIMNGDGNGRFRPEANITRAEFVSVFTRFFAAEAGSVPYIDVLESKWYYNDIVTAQVKGWVSGKTESLFMPGDPIKRSEAAKIINRVLERYHDPDFAKDRDDTDKHFPDVPASYWAFLEIIEAAEPAVKTVEPPSGEGEYIRTITTVNFRSGPSTSYSVITSLATGTILTVIDSSSYQPWIKAKLADGREGYIHSDYVTEYNGGLGDGTISASSVSVPQYKTVYLTSTGAGLAWVSDNTNIAVIVGTKVADSTKGFVYGKAAGTANVQLKNAAGTVVSTCKVTVTAPEAVRFTYADPNTPSAGVNFNLTAVTDTGKSEVKFVVSGAASGEYTTTAFTTESQTSSLNPQLPANTVRVFTKQVNFSLPGSYTVKAYSKTASGSWSTAYAENKILVVSTKSETETSAETRTVSTKMIGVIGNFEGYATDVYLDTIATPTNLPTVGYGYAMFNANSLFYNNLTKTEMTAMLTATLNTGSYVSGVENFRKNNNVKMSQCQFDALVSFAYNLGAGSLNESYDTFKVLMNAVQTPSLPASGTINVGSPTLYNQAGTGDSNGSLSNGTAVTVTEVKRVDGDVDNLWYKVTGGGKTGWVRGGRIRLGTSNRDLAYIDEQAFGSNLLEWNYSGGARLPGLVTRRLGEAKIFCYANYADAYHSSANYTNNVGFDVPSNFTYTVVNGKGVWTWNGKA